MKSTKENLWLQVVLNDGYWLQDTGRLASIVQAMPNPETQTPQLLHFVGNTVKDKLTCELFPDSYSRQASMTGLSDLRALGSTVNSSTPLLLADSNPFIEPPRQLSENTDVSLKVKWTVTSPRHIISVLLARLSFLFSDVICIFTDDFPDLRSVAVQLIEWAKTAQASNLPSAPSPTVILVFSNPGSQQQIEDHIGAPEWAELSSAFTLSTPFYLNYDGNYSQLKNVLLSSLEGVRNRRCQQGFLMSCNHFAAFHYQALEHVTNTTTHPFNFILQTRVNNAIHDDDFSHISTFLQLGLELNISHNDLASFIASAILMDAYPPKMHCFPPKEIFHALYMSICSKAASQMLDAGTATALSSLIERHLERLFPVLMEGSRSSAQIHSDNLTLHHRHWSQMRSNHTCLFCLRRKPEEHVLSCGHAICDQCPRIFGRESTEANDRFIVSPCILCKSQSTLIANLNPPTANLSILSIDGGGTRGVIPLEVLRAMQELIETPLADLFDLSAGTSSGALIIIGLIIIGWDVHKCSHVFDTLARRVFHRSPWFRSRLWNFLTDLVRCVVSDGIYDARTMERTLMDTFGSQRPMFGYVQGSSGKKALVTATDTENSSTLVFATYNGAAPVERQHEYEFVHHNVTDEPLLWKIGRATSAAPGLYKPVEMELPLPRTLQDGGLGGHNNPTLLCLLERRRLLSFHVSGYVLSLGTGQRADYKALQKKNDDATASQSPNSDSSDMVRWLHNHAVFRLSRSLGRCIDGDQLASRLFQEEIVRFNVELPGPLRMSDTAGMETLRRTVQADLAKSSHILEETVHALIERFYFVLDRSPKRDGSRFYCEGSIRCRGNSRTIIPDLLRLKGARMEFITDSEALGDLNVSTLDSDTCPICKRFRKKVTFSVDNLTNLVNIYLRYGREEKRKISSFPQSMQWFIHRQYLGACFGSMDHGSPGRLICCSTEGLSSSKPAVGLRKRKQTMSQTVLGPKRLRLSQL